MNLLDKHVEVLPTDADKVTLVGRVFDPQVNGPCVVLVRQDRLDDATGNFPTMTVNPKVGLLRGLDRFNE